MNYKSIIKNMKLFQKKLCIFMALSLIASLTIYSSSTDTYAASSNGANIYNLSLDKTIKKYDITGDKKKDKIKIKTEKSLTISGTKTPYVQKLTVYVNGKQCLHKSYGSGMNVSAKLIQLKNKKTLIYITAYYVGGGLNSGDFYVYKSSKLKSTISVDGLYRKVVSYWDDYAGNDRVKYVGYMEPQFHKVSGNSIYIRIDHYGNGEFNSGNELYRYDYKNGMLKMHKTFPLKYSKTSLDLKDYEQQIWPFISTKLSGKAGQGNVIPVKITSSNKAVATATRDSHLGAGFSLRINTHKRGTTILTITAADGRKAKLKLTVK